MKNWKASYVYFCKQLLALVLLALFSGCTDGNFIKVFMKDLKKTDSLNVGVSNIQIINHQIVITGTNLNTVSSINIKEGSTTTNLQIESQSATSIVSNTLSSVTFAAGKVFDFILSNASAAATFTINFSLCDSSLNGKGFNCTVTPNDKEVLSYDAATGKWLPRAVNGLSYQGSWDATTSLPTTTTPGDYYIVSVAHAGYLVGDWIVFNGTTFDQIHNSTVITSVFGRTGAITATKGDYTLTKMSDVDLTTTTPVTGNVLKFDGTNWVPGTVSSGGGGTVTSVSGSSPISISNGATTPVVSIAQATSSANGYLSSADWTTFNNKQSNITAGTTSQYYRGDKTFVTLDTSVVPENTNLYHTDARVLATPITAPTLTNSAIATSDSIQVALGKLQAQFNNTLSLVLTGLSTATNSAITAADSFLVAMGKLQAQITSLGSTKLDKTGGTLSVGTIDGVPTPTTANQVANKAYVDSVAASSSSATCPTGYVLVPANTSYFPKQFCVMKYDAKNDGYGVAVSTASGTPWASIDRPTARTKCQSLGAGYDLISNDQWQTIARNIASVATNWSSGVVGSGELNRGHSDNSPASALAASSDDVSGNCSGTGQTCSSTVWDSQRRTFVLSNGNIVWDIAGNICNWTTNDNGTTNGSDGSMATMSSGDIRQTRYGADSTTICSSPSSSPYCGMGYGWFNSTGAVLRGRAWDSGTNSGVFTTDLSNSSSTSSVYIGFRCVFVP